MSIAARAVTAVACVILAALGALIGSAFLWEAIERRDSLEADWTALKTSYGDKYRKTQQFDALKDQLHYIETTLGPALRSIGLEDDQSGDFDRIQQHAAAHRLEILSYQPASTPREIEDFYAVDHFDLQLAGAYRDLAEFCTKVANDGQLVAIESLSLTRRGTGVLAKMRVGHYTILPEPEA
jgi:Tfp pilus assembly protein PilO